MRNSEYDLARIKSHTMYQLEPSKGDAPFVPTAIRCRHSDTRHRDGSIQIGRWPVTTGVA